MPELIPSTTMWMMRRGVPEARGRFSVLDFLGALAAAPNAVAVSAETAGAVTSDLRKCRRGFMQVDYFAIKSPVSTRGNRSVDWAG
jgi:hypothetical protein